MSSGKAPRSAAGSQARQRIGRIASAIGRRLAGALAVVVTVSLLTFSLVHLAPGNAEDAILGYGRLTPEALSAVREQYGLDRPLPQQYFHWVSNAVQFDFNVSPRTREPVSKAIAERWRVSFFLATYAFILTVLIGIPAGIVAALHHSGSLDRALSASSLLALCAPPFATSMLLLYLFAVSLGWFPVAGAGRGFLDRLAHLTLPALALAIGAIGYLMRVTRAAVTTELARDYTTFARARGLSFARVVFVHVLRNAAIPVVTMSGFVFTSLVTGALLVEIVFSLPGLGLLLAESLAARDIPMIQGITLLFAAFIVSVNLLVDLIYVALNPRIRLGQAGL